MIRNLKVLGLALVAVFAMGAVVASAASAQQGMLTSDGPVLLDGTEISGETNALTAFGSVLSCPGSTYLGEAVGGGPIESGATQGTIVPFFNNSTCNSGGLKITISTNGCDVIFTSGEKIAENEYSGTGELTCPAGKTVDAEVFLSSSNENIKACTIVGSPQEGSGTGTLTNTAEGAEVRGTVTGIHATESGLCGSKTTESAELDFAAAVTGTDVEKNPTTVEVPE
jgi:hypothetical protein